MKVKITKPCVISVLPGSVVEISEYQMKFLQGFVEPIEVKEKPETQQRTTRKVKK